MFHTKIIVSQPKLIEDKINKTHQEMHEQGYELFKISLNQMPKVFGLVLHQACLTYKKIEG